LFAGGPQPGLPASGTWEIVISSILMLLVFSSPGYFLYFHPWIRRKKGKGSATGRLKYITVLIYLAAVSSIIAGFRQLIQINTFFLVYFWIMGISLFILGVYVRKKSKTALWCVEGVLMFALIGPFVIKYITIGMPLMNTIHITYLIRMCIFTAIGIGGWTSITNLGFVTLTDLKQEEEKISMGPGQ
jgi:hypothetical protein